VELSVKRDGREPMAKIKLDLSAKRIEIMGEKAVEIDTPEVKIGQGTKKCNSVNVGNPNATRINFRGTDFTFNGKRIKIG
jgi:hypothetical protein